MLGSQGLQKINYSILWPFPIDIVVQSWSQKQVVKETMAKKATQSRD